MEPAPYRFGAFELDGVGRQLRRGGEEVALNARYLDALILLVRESGGLVTKDRFMDEVWRGVPVTDEALTQCIRTLRRALGDEVGAPRFIATVPKYGYRFVARLEGAVAPTQSAPDRFGSSSLVERGMAGTSGAVLAGTIGGTLYGMAAALAVPSGGGSLSMLLVLLCVTLALAAIGGGAVSFGIAIAVHRAGDRSPLVIAGGALGGFLVGAAGKMLGLDAFGLLLGRTPEGITGALEGGALGAALGFGYWLAVRGGTVRRAALTGALCGGVAGLVIALAGGRLLAGSLDQLTQAMPGSRLRLGGLGTLLGETGFGLRSRIGTGMVEGALFGAGVVAGLWRARGPTMVEGEGEAI